MTRELLVFDVWAPFGFFRKSETTTSSLTFAFIPRSAAEGLVGAILGLDFDESPVKLVDAQIAVGIRSPVRKMPYSATYTDTKEIWPRLGALIETSRKGISKSRRKVAFRTRIKIELLRNPHYRIYFDGPEQTKKALEERLQKHETVFTPYLGSSSMIANFSYVGRYRYEQMKTTAPTPIDSVVPFIGIMPKIVLEKDVTFAVEQNIPIHLTSERVLAGTYNAIYSPSGAQMKVHDIEAQKVRTEEKDQYVIFIPTEIPSEKIT